MERMPNADGRIDDRERVAPLIVGLGAAGISAANAVIRSGMPCADFAAMDSDLQRLKSSLAARTIHMPPECVTYTACADALFARGARQGFCDLKWCIIVADMADETSVIHASALARTAKDRGWHVFGLSPAPVRKKAQPAGLEMGLVAKNLRKHMDALLVFPCDLPGEKGFAQTDALLSSAVKGLAEPFAHMNLISLDLADLTAAFGNPGLVDIGAGTARGEGRALRAAKQALAALPRSRLRFHTDVFINITGWNMSPHELSDIINAVQRVCRKSVRLLVVDSYEKHGGKLAGHDFYCNRWRVGGIDSEFFI